MRLPLKKRETQARFLHGVLENIDFSQPLPAWGELRSKVSSLPIMEEWPTC